MFVVFVIVAAAVLFGAVLLVLGRGDVLQPEVSGGAAQLLPDGAVHSGDVAELRFSVVHRGYRMDQVDTVLDRLQRELAWRDHRLAELESRIPGLGNAPLVRPAAEADPLPRRRPAHPGDAAGGA
ncbi:DivIVA domain-containing protein [Jiangella aurantiaca]|uniref:DivIVA domain-containing protein n=1 Tax=Jiangella aurantiaca TaxID=2530373 RepID=A0A4R4ZZF6_9ACTN|nr:DivIVA domain-containing protein [Jiangella aurantiaca]TDD64731.1 DivIVA domain-containing protein [Jiangella aurantiaca]